MGHSVMAKKLSDIALPSQSEIVNQRVVIDNHALKPTQHHIDAVSHLFTELELAYHNQFHKAFPDNKSLTMAKQLWLRLLIDQSPEHIAKAGRQAICDNTFLPTPHNIREYCESLVMHGIPDVKRAFIEACMSREPRQRFAWTHPIVYHAGTSTGWFFLSGQPETITFPVFERNYLLLLERLKQGEDITLPIVKAIEKKTSQPLSTIEQQQRMVELRKQLDL
tara:strand:- start:680 stop:1345 length:666 start_codon:yes stop_codon:yes gene_type:complete